jgi:cytochrome c oxidase subunit III
MNGGRPILDVSPLRTYGFGPHSVVWLGQMWMALIESVLFLMALATYFYIRLQFTHWPPPGNNVPSLVLPTVNVVILLLSCIPMHIADKAVLKCEWRPTIIATAITIAMGGVYLALRFVEWRRFDFAWDTNIYGSIVWFILGLHTAHVIAALLETTFLLYLALIGKRDERVRQGMNVDEIYWFFVVGTGILLYGVIYVAPMVI